MTRKEYMKKLTARLSFRLPAEAVADIAGEISERFEEGAAEGMDEAAVCSLLGDPYAAAADFLRECGGENKPSHGRVIGITASLLLSAAFVLADPFAVGSPTARVHMLLLAMPIMIWLICEGRGWRKSLCRSACDIAMAMSAVLLTGAGVCCALLVNEAIRSPDSLDFLFMLLCTAFTVGAMAAWAFTVSRRGEKYMLILHGLGAAAAVWSAAVSFDFFGADRIRYGGNSFEHDKEAELAMYYGEAGGYFRNFLLLIILLSAACTVWAVIKRDRLSPCTLSLLLGCFASSADNLYSLRRVDPMDTEVQVSVVPFIFTLACTAVWLAVTMVIGMGYKNSNE